MNGILDHMDMPSMDLPLLICVILFISLVCGLLPLFQPIGTIVPIATLAHIFMILIMILLGLILHLSHPVSRVYLAVLTRLIPKVISPLWTICVLTLALLYLLIVLVVFINDVSLGTIAHSLSLHLIVHTFVV